MKVLIIVGLVAVAAAYEPFNTFNYHENIGIPEALRIKEMEQSIENVDSRIIGGAPSKVSDHPYLAGMVITLTSGAISACAGSLLSTTKSLTAAHCWWDGFSQARSITVVLGSSTLFTGGVRVPSIDVEMHGNFNPFSSNNNIAVVTFRDIELSANIQVIALVTGTALHSGLWATGSGFGQTSDTSAVGNNQSASQAILQVITNAACQQYYGTWSVITSNLCTGGTGGVGVCGGDSGGPLVIGSGSAKQLIGIASYASHRGCQLGLPSVFTRVNSFTAWINARL